MNCTGHDGWLCVCVCVCVYVCGGPPTSLHAASAYIVQLIKLTPEGSTYSIRGSC